MNPDLFFEDFPVGRVFHGGPRIVTKEEIFAFAEEFDPQPHHLDEAAANASMLQGLSASGWHVGCLAMRMICDAWVLRAASMGAPGVDEMRWIKPVRPGDTLTLIATVTAARVSAKRPEMGVVSFDWRIDNQDGQVAAMRGSAFYALRHPEAA
jgi:acyl dehydratase